MTKYYNVWVGYSRILCRHVKKFLRPDTPRNNSKCICTLLIMYGHVNFWLDHTLARFVFELYERGSDMYIPFKTMRQHL